MILFSWSRRLNIWRDSLVVKKRVYEEKTWFPPGSSSLHPLLEINWPQCSFLVVSVLLDLKLSSEEAWSMRAGLHVFLTRLKSGCRPELVTQRRVRPAQYVRHLPASAPSPTNGRNPHLPPPLCTGSTATTAWSRRRRGWNAKQVTCCLSAIFGSGLWHWMRGA